MLQKVCPKIPHKPVVNFVSVDLSFVFSSWSWQLNSQHPFVISPVPLSSYCSVVSAIFHDFIMLENYAMYLEKAHGSTFSA